MSNPADNQPPSDEMLVAYLDGEMPAAERARLEALLAADGEARARLERLARGGNDIKSAFDALIDEAPAGRLAAVLSAVENAARPPAAAVSGWRPSLIAASLAMLIVGALAGYLAATAVQRDEAGMPDYWREVVAEYVAIYTTDTFAGIPDDTAIHAAALAGVGSKIGIPLTPEMVALPGLTLKGGIIFSIDGKPLAQVAYLSPEYGPIAFCIIDDGQPDRPPAFETREGRNIVYWAKGGRGFLVIGTAPRTDLEGYAATLGGRIS